MTIWPEWVRLEVYSENTAWKRLLCSFCSTKEEKKITFTWCQRSQFTSNIASCELQDVFMHYSMQQETKLTSLLTTDDRLETCAIIFGEYNNKRDIAK